MKNPVHPLKTPFAPVCQIFNFALVGFSLAVTGCSRPDCASKQVPNAVVHFAGGIQQPSLLPKPVNRSLQIVPRFVPPLYDGSQKVIVVKKPVVPGILVYQKTFMVGRHSGIFGKIKNPEHLKPGTVAYEGGHGTYTGGTFPAIAESYVVIPGRSHKKLLLFVVVAHEHGIVKFCIVVF